MLKIGQLAQIKSDSPYVYEALTQIVNGVNAVGRATGVDPSGTLDPPAPIGSLSVTAADGIFDLAITDNSSVHRGIFYFAESDTTHYMSHKLYYVYYIAPSNCVNCSIRDLSGPTRRRPFTNVVGVPVMFTLRPSSIFCSI